MSKGDLRWGQEPPDYKPKGEPLDWPEIVRQLRAAPRGQWARLMHSYASDTTARSSVAKQSTTYGLEYRTSTTERDPDGHLAVWVRIPSDDSEGEE